MKYQKQGIKTIERTINSAESDALAYFLFKILIIDLKQISSPPSLTRLKREGSRSPN